MYEDITRQARAVVTELLEQAKLKPGALLVIGCSSSEIVGARIGKGIPGGHRDGAAGLGLGHHIDDLIAPLFRGSPFQDQCPVQMLTALYRQLDSPLL